ncbi:S-adenosyl-L-methionine-dependent methyltransferase [Lasiosphaeria miniovina]|uniref:S-adenosyl-L-methionine-dependent methyltransferase n=1 Tax=Lasiosphaeria miniovina TaxID=1954250 RepID=A0AA40AAQ4_9PEZI|nr:S-adenosyl-L-methionine-dependent methyltransferase [Lasiosphaeria miniovina]KAK0712422.1 S-adenosyl-L-methionine-dependent methyltransferase [Lasiosphaeria miniovina]
MTLTALPSRPAPNTMSTTTDSGPPNLSRWNLNADWWDQKLLDGNDMFLELILPTIDELADVKPGQRVLDVGTGNGIVARRLARDGVDVLATDYSLGQIENAWRRTQKSAHAAQIAFEQLDLLSRPALDDFAQRHPEEFDLVTGSMLLKELSDLRPLAEFLPKILKPAGRVIFANLHPAFHKPGAHRLIEVAENPDTGVQEIKASIKVEKYLNIGPVQSSALRGQPEPLIWFHRPIHELLEPFFDAGLALNKVREPSFSNGPDPSQAQSYHNFPQIPMQFIFRLVRLPGQ